MWTEDRSQFTLRANFLLILRGQALNLSFKNFIFVILDRLSKKTAINFMMYSNETNKPNSLLIIADDSTPACKNRLSFITLCSKSRGGLHWENSISLNVSEPQLCQNPVGGQKKYYPYFLENVFLVKWGICKRSSSFLCKRGGFRPICEFILIPRSSCRERSYDCPKMLRKICVILQLVVNTTSTAGPTLEKRACQTLFGFASD